MKHDFEQYDEDQKALLLEELSDAELNELLVRLNAIEFLADPLPTIGDVVEATGASPSTIGQILAAIRKEAFEKRFERTFVNHETRIESLEAETQRLQKRRTAKSVLGVKLSDPRKQEILEELVDREQRRKELDQVKGVFCLIFLLVLLMAILSHNADKAQSSPTTSFPPFTGR